jgi:hypothetical protein
MKQIAAFLIVLLLLVPLTTSAQDFCEGNFDYDQDVDGSDASTFKADFGRSPFKNPCPPDGPAPVEKTGQNVVYGPRDDGYWQQALGVEWPDPRFTDNFDGTVTDNLTGLLWLKNANCFGSRTWDEALSDANGLSAGWCGLTDGSSAHDWRLPNIKELQSLIDFGNTVPALPSGHPFINLHSGLYWSSTTDAYASDYAWGITIYYGNVYSYEKTSHSFYVWPVRRWQ